MLLYYMFYERHNLSIKVVFQFQSLMSLTVHLKQENFLSSLCTADSQFLEKNIYNFNAEIKGLIKAKLVGLLK